MTSANSSPFKDAERTSTRWLARGWYRHPQGTVAYEYTGTVQQASRAAAPNAESKTLKMRKPARGHDFACLIPGHFEAGMIGKVTVR